MSDVNVHSQGVQNPPNMRNEPVLNASVPDGHARMATVGLETGIPGTGGILPGMMKEYSGWDVYNNEAKKVDTELVKDWTSNLNSLLLFAAVFAAVLTAFIIESKKLLELDPADAMLAVMIFLANNMENGTYALYNQPEFISPPPAVTINCLFFASLCLSLVAALASVVALQWVGDYDAAITRGGSSPEDRAKRRQFRHAGVISWRMGEIIAVIPLLLYSSVILFFIGLTIWMWIIHKVVGIVITGGVGLTVLFYGGSTILSVIFVSAPFRTPLSRWIYSILRLPFSLGFPVVRAIRDSSIQAWLARRENVLWNRLGGLNHNYSPITELFASICGWLAHYMLFLSILPWLEERYLQRNTPIKREDIEVEKRKNLATDALIWLATQLSISPDSYDRLLLLLSGILKVEATVATPLTLDAVPLLPIFDFLCREIMKKEIQEDISPEELRAVGILAQCYQISGICDAVSPPAQLEYDTDDGDWEYWRQYCWAIWNHQIKSSEHRPNCLYLLFRDIPTPSEHDVHQLEVAIRLSRWRNAGGKTIERWCQIADFCFTQSTPFSDRGIETLRRFIAAQYYGWWAEMAVYLANEYKGPHIPSILKIQALTLPASQQPDHLWSRAFQSPAVVAHLRRVFQYPVPCPGHHDGDGHLLLHLFYDYPAYEFPIDIAAFTSVPLKGRHLSVLLVLWILPQESQVISALEEYDTIDPQCFPQIMEMLDSVKRSQFSALALLSDMCSCILHRDANGGRPICSEDVLAMSICLQQALELPSDLRTTVIIPELADRIRKLDARMLTNNYRSAEENAAASLIAAEVINWLHTSFSATSVFGRGNRRLLSCARAPQGLSPAAGWLAPYAD